MSCKAAIIVKFFSLINLSITNICIYVMDQVSSRFMKLTYYFLVLRFQ